MTLDGVLSGLGDLLPRLWSAVGSLLGVAVGFGLAKWDEGQRVKREATSVRQLLAEEVGDNWQDEGDFWSRATGNLTIDQWRGPDILDRHPEVLDLLARTPAPAWGRDIWDSQLPRLSVALNREELEQVYRFYRCLSAIKKRHAELQALTDSPGLQSPRREIDGIARDVEGIVQDIGAAHLELQGAGLPLREEAPRRRRWRQGRMWPW
jgi:hypothetical protein